MQLELYFYNECGFSQSVLNTITNLKIGDKIIMKNIRENPEHDQKLTEMCGSNKVPILVVDGEPMRESEEIKKFLVSKFL